MSGRDGHCFSYICHTITEILVKGVKKRERVAEVGKGILYVHRV